MNVCVCVCHIQEVLIRADAKIGFSLTQIIMEYCDKGSLLQAIDKGLFSPTSRWGARLALRALLRTAQEIALGMVHIHQCNVIHGGEAAFCLHALQFAHAAVRLRAFMGDRSTCRMCVRVSVCARLDVRNAKGISGMCVCVSADLKPGNVLLKSSRADRRGFVAKVCGRTMVPCNSISVAQDRNDVRR